MKLFSKKLFVFLGLAFFILIQSTPLVFGQVTIAQQGPAPGDLSVPGVTGPTFTTVPNTPPSSTTGTPPATTGVTNAAVTNSNLVVSRLSNGVECNLTLGIFGSGDFLGCIANALSAIGVIVGYLFWLSAILLNWIVYITLNSASWIGSGTNMGGAIQGVWQVLRDLANMFFIFVIIYIGVSTMLDLSWVDTRKQLVRVIVIAILINFSLVVTRVVIDASNVAAYGFYDAFPNAAKEESFREITPEKKDTRNLAEKLVDSTNPFLLFDLGSHNANDRIFSVKNPGGSKNLAAPFMRVTDVTEVVGPETFSKSVAAKTNPATSKTEGNSSSTIVISLFMFVIMQIIGSFVLFAAGILFITRTVLLIMLMIVSPIAFICYSTPKLEKYWKQWWDKLLHQAFFAPIFLGFYYIASVIFTASASNNFFSVKDLAGDESVFGAIAAMFIQFVIATAFMIIALLSAKALGASGASTLVNWGDKKRKAAVGFAGQHTLGRLGQRINESDAMKKFVANNPRLGSLALRPTEARAKGKYGGTASYKDKIKAVEKRQEEMYDYVSKDKYGNPLSVPTYTLDPLTGTYDETGKESTQDIFARNTGTPNSVHTRSSREVAKAVKAKHKKTTTNKERGDKIDQEIKDLIGDPENNTPGRKEKIQQGLAKTEDRINVLQTKEGLSQAETAELSHLYTKQDNLNEKIDTVDSKINELQRQKDNFSQMESLNANIGKQANKESKDTK